MLGRLSPYPVGQLQGWVPSPASPDMNTYTYLLGICPRWIFWAFSSSCQAIQDPNVP